MAGPASAGIAGCTLDHDVGAADDDSGDNGLEPDCAAGCDEVAAASCSAGPPDVPSCIQGCETNLEGECELELAVALECMGDEPSVTCSESGQPWAEACDMELAAFYTCIGS